MHKPVAAVVNNLKFILIALVVANNAIEPLIGSHVGLRTLYQSIYTFHIPMFVFAMGLLAQRGRKSTCHELGAATHTAIGISWEKPDQADMRSLLNLAWQYLLFQSLYSLADVFLFHAPHVIHSFFMPYSLLWFLCSHFCWRFMLGLFVQLNRPVFAILGAVLLGVLVGFLPLPGALLSISRTFVLFPFYLAGYYCRMDQARMLQLRRWRLPATAFAVAWFVGLALYGHRLPFAWQYGNATYAELHMNEWAAGLRLAYYGVQAVVSVAFLSWIPWTDRGWTALGGRTVFVFLLHGLLLKALIAAGVYEPFALPMQIVLALAIAAALVAALSQSCVQRWVHPVIEPPFPELPLFRRRLRQHKRG